MRAWQSIVFVVQWVMVVVLPVWWFGEPGSGTPGWSAVLMLLLGPLLAIGLVVPAIIATANRANRRARATAPAYAVVAPAAWLVAIAVPMGIDGADDMRSYPSVFATWGMPQGAEGPVLIVLGLVLVGLLVAAAVLAIQPVEALPEGTKPPW